jgi:hypothetical protein
MAITYLVFSIVASVLISGKSGWDLFPVLPLVFACFHFGYGYGFMRGVWDSLLLRRGPGRAFTRSTRAVSD